MKIIKNSLMIHGVNMIKKFLKSTLTCFGLVLFSLFCVTTVNAQTVSAQDFIMKLSEDLLTEIKTNKDLLAGDFTKLKEVADKKVLPYINMNKLTASAVGRPWRDATPAQKKQLIEEFQILLMRTYSGAMHKAKDAKVVVLPSRQKESSTDKVLVRTSVTNPGAEAINVDYRVEKNEDTWSIYDVSVLGVWLSESYKNSFAVEIQKTGIDGLIAQLKEKNNQVGALVKGEKKK